MKLFVVLSALILAVTSKPQSVEDFIDEINSSQDLWRAAPNHITAKGLTVMKKRLGARRREDRSGFALRTLDAYDIGETKIPKSFDARKKWPECSTISSIKDQSECGACWAVAAASTMSDRLCIASKNKVNVNISAENLISCCNICGDGCDGGYPDTAWDYFRDTGIVTGGDYGSDEGCQPYETAPCGSDPEEHLPPCHAVPPKTPACHSNKCTNKLYQKEFEEDKHYGENSYYVDSSVMQSDIMKYGPVVAGFDVYEDFVNYKSGVYKHVSGELMGGHAVRVLGWGVENGTKYWLAANSWNRFWGDNGLFKIVMGTNECGFESSVTTGNVKPI